MGRLSWIAIFISTFFFMELAAYLLHKYVMHGFLWSLHQDHHVQNKNRKWQKNDFFAFVFAIPSFCFILIDSLLGAPALGSIGFGIMAYGGAYFLVHEVIIHRRIVLFSRLKHWYLVALNTAHKVHHANHGKENTHSLGMLVVPWKYFRDSRIKNNKK
ncbi:MAG: sterol desaturase family protein [Bacteriovoracaceae bacterium]|nr:sterol desaturase family protein [Bacteriovoracaceae bacterium]